MQELKLFDDNCRDPEQDVFVVFVVMVVVSIASEKVTETLAVLPIEFESEGEVEEIVGDVVSVLDGDKD